MFEGLPIKAIPHCKGERAYNRRCPACGVDNWCKVFKRLGFDFVKCNSCGIVRTEPIPSFEEISDHYAKKLVKDNYDLIQRYDKDYEAIYKQFLKFTTLYSGDPRGKNLIDIGCFTGRFLDVAKQAGFLTHGVEYQSEAAMIASEKHEGRVHCGPIENYSESISMSGFFDVVTLFGVIEHVTAPGNTIRIIADLIKKGGLFIIQTPNTASFPARVLGKWWPVYAPIEHIHYFSSRNIRILLAKYSFEVVNLVTHWKKLPVAYVYSQFQNFGPEYYKLLSNIIPFVPKNVLNWKLPFYGGEMLLVTKKI